MKNTLLFLFALMLAGIFKTQGQTLGHTTISLVKVSYAAASQTVTGNLPVLRGIPQATVVLNPGAIQAKIYFKIVNPADNTIVYQSDYLLSSAVVNNNSGKKLFENTNGTIFLSNGNALQVKPYRYELQTEDSTGKLTKVYTILQ